MALRLLQCEASSCSLIARHAPLLCCHMRSLFFAARPLSRAASSVASKRHRPHISASVVQVGGITISREEVVKEEDPTNNVPDTVFSKIGLHLHRRDDHPLCILKNEIYKFFEEKFPGQYQKFDDLSPIVSTKSNFDDVLVPPDHVSRSYNDTYYINTDTVLRTHTSAHQAQKLRDGFTHFLVMGDVYRRDSIDATHYPVFHQMEGFRVFSPAEWEAANMDGTSFALQNLKETLEGLAKQLFGDVETRWVDTYFPFTNPSLELEIFFQLRKESGVNQFLENGYVVNMLQQRYNVLRSTISCIAALTVRNT